MIDLDVGFNQKQYDFLMKRLDLLADEREIIKAINKAAKKAANEAKKETTKLIPAAFTIPVSEVKSGIKVRANRGSEPGAVMQITGGAIPLYDFEGVTPREVMPPAKGPVRAKVKQSGGAELSRVFVAKMQSGHIGLFEREAEKRKSERYYKKDEKRNKAHTHIFELWGTGLTGMFGTETETPINTAVIQKAGEFFNQQVIVELEALLNG